MGMESRELSLHFSWVTKRKKGREVRQKANVILRPSRRTCFVLVLSSFFGYNDYLTLKFRKLLKLVHHILSFSDKDITTNSPLNNGKLP
jgi:hypothetical protein